MSHNVLEICAAMRAQNRWLSELDTELAKVRGQHQKRLSEHRKRFAKEQGLWVSSLMPNLDESTLKALVEKTHCTEIAPDRVEVERQRLKAFYVKKIALLDEEFDPSKTDETRAMLQINKTELEEQLDPLGPYIEPAEECAHFDELIRSGYGTEAYAIPFWRMAYYKHWKYGDLVLEAVGERYQVEDFGAFAKKYTPLKKDHTLFTRELNLTQSRLQRLSQVIGERERWVTQTNNLEETLLAQNRGRLNEWLELLSDAELFALSDEQSFILGAKRVSVARARCEYLEKYFLRYVNPLQKNITKTILKNRKHLIKYARPKHSNVRFSDQEFEKRFDPKRRQKWVSRLQNYRKAALQIDDFDDIESYDIAKCPPWITLMVDKQVKTGFLEDVRQYKIRRAAESHMVAAAVSTSHDDFMDVS